MKRLRLEHYRRDVEREIARDQAMTDALMPIGRKIAAATRATSPMARAEPGRYGKPTVERRAGGGVTVTTDGPFAHIDEWGGANSPPSAAMRRSAARFGKFREEAR